MRSDVSALVASIRQGLSPLAGALPALAIALNQRVVSTSARGAFSASATSRTATIVQNASATKDLLIYRVRFVGVLAVAATGRVSLVSSSRTITGGAISPDALGGQTGIHNCLRPILWPKGSSIVCTIDDPTTAAGGSLIVDGYAVDSDTASMVTDMVGTERIYELAASATVPSPTGTVQTGRFEPQEVFRDTLTVDGDNTRLYIGPRENVFPMSVPGVDVPDRTSPLTVLSADRTLLSIGEQLRLETAALAGANALRVLVRGGEWAQGRRAA